MKKSNDKFLKLIGQKVRSCRKTKQWSQERLAEVSGLHHTYISNIEQGSVNASISIFNTLANALETDLHSLFYGITTSDGIDSDFLLKTLKLLEKVNLKDEKNREIFLTLTQKLAEGLQKFDDKKRKER